MLINKIVIIYFWLFLVGTKTAYKENSIAYFKLSKMLVLEKKNVNLYYSMFNVNQKRNSQFTILICQ